MNKTRGFTLIEALVAIAIVTIAISGCMTTASSAIRAADAARDQLAASYLAQEGIEYVRWERDSIYLADYPSAASYAWEQFLSAVRSQQCEAPNFCTLGLFNQNTNSFPASVSCSPSGSCPSAFTLISNGTSFSRTVQMTRITDTDEKITSNVSWLSHGTTYSVAITDHFTPWQ